MVLIEKRFQRYLKHAEFASRRRRSGIEERIVSEGYELEDSVK